MIKRIIKGKIKKAIRELLEELLEIATTAEYGYDKDKKTAYIKLNKEW